MTLKFSMLATMAIISLSCAKKPDDASTTTGSVLYVSSGLCNSGATNTTFTAATAGNIIYTVDLATGNPTIISDYNTAAANAGDTPTFIANYDNDNLVALVENATSTAFRRLEKIPKKSTGTKSTLYSNATAFSSALRALFRATDGTMLISRSTGIEKLNTTPARMTASGNSWVLGSSLVGNCATSATYISSVVTSPTGRIIYTHANAAQNRVGVIKSTGYVAAADCTGGLASAVATAFPTASVYLASSNKVLVLYAGTTAAANNYVSVYDFDDSTGVLSNETIAFADTSILYGGSAMTYDSATGYLYIATANSTATTVGNYNIEKFTFDATTRLMTRVGSVPFATGWYGSKCISSMYIGN